METIIFNIRQTTGTLLQKTGYVFRLPYPKRALLAIAKEGNRWVVSELSTGYAIAFGKWDGTRKATIAKAAKILQRVGARKLKQYTDEIITEQGKAN